MEVEVKWLDLFRHDELQNLCCIVLGAFPQAIQQFTGISAVVDFGPTILAGALGLSPRPGAIADACGSTCFCIGSCIPVPLIERTGRPIMIWGLMTNCISIAGLAVAACYAQFPKTQSAAGYGFTACILSYLFFYGASWARIPWVWVYTPEINSYACGSRATPPRQRLSGSLTTFSYKLRQRV